jgi:cytochrome P450
VPIATGDKVLVWEGSANRDESVFERAGEFDITRDPNPHVGFGHGIHYCLGAALGRLNVAALVNAVLDRYSTIEATDEPPTVGTVSIFTHALWRLPIELRH